MRPFLRTWCVSTAIALALVSCGGGNGGGTTPVAPAPAVANISVTTTTITGSRLSTGFSYETVVQVRESAGVAATINSIELTFLDGVNPFGQISFESPMADSSNRIAANGSAASKRLTTTDGRPGTPYATGVRVKVTFTDDNKNPGFALATADVPALPQPPPTAQTYSLNGVVLEVPGDFRVRGARVEVGTGPNAGATSTTNDNGQFSFAALRSGTFTLNVSKSEYDTVQQAVTLSSNATVTLSLRKSAAPPPPPPPGVCAPRSAPCGPATAVCRNGALSCSQTRQGTCSSNGGVSCFICPGVLCNGFNALEQLDYTPVPLKTPTARIQ